MTRVVDNDRRVGDVISADRSAEEHSALRVLTCNVRRAAGDRARRLSSWLAGTCANVLVLTEVSSSSSGGVLVDLLSDEGYQSLLPAPDPDDRYRLIVAWRGAEVAPVDVGPVGLAHRCAAVQVLAAGVAVGIVGVYVPSRGPRSARNKYKRAFQASFADLLPSIPGLFPSGGPTLVTGDLNVVEPGHTPHYPVFGKWEYDFYKAFSAAGFDDAFRAAQPLSGEHSWFGRPRADGSRNGYRFDHAFIDRHHRASVVSCRYEHSVRTRGLTDHSALAVTIAL